MPFTCVTGGIEPYIPSNAKPWDKRRVMHLGRRIAFGFSYPEIESALDNDPVNLIIDLLDEAHAMPSSPAPIWANWVLDDYEGQEDDLIFIQANDWSLQWVKEMHQVGLREKIALFWHNHFVTIYNDYFCTPSMYKYHKLLQDYCFGNFKDFVYEIGRTPAMLYFLNGATNTSEEPNENYARELYELFTLGQGNGYTQMDITETARALTGVTSLDCQETVFFNFLHDNENKTIFGQTGNWGYDEVVDILFEQRTAEICQHICTKIYRHFVSDQLDEAIINELAFTMEQNNFEMLPVFKQLFVSEHFFDDAIVGCKIKSPMDYILNFANSGSFPVEEESYEFIRNASAFLGQEIFNPVDVAGWPGNRSWIDTNFLTYRWAVADAILGLTFEYAPQILVDFAKLVSNNSIDPLFVTQSISDHFMPNGLQNEQAYIRATEIFKTEIPQNYFDDGLWNLDWEIAPAQVALLMLHLLRLPEYQLS